MDATKTIEMLISQAKHWIALITGLAILILVAGAVARALGWPIPYIPGIGHEALAYTCGAWWLARK